MERKQIGSILIVDDDDMVRRALRRKLENVNKQVWTASGSNRLRMRCHSHASIGPTWPSST